MATGSSSYSTLTTITPAVRKPTMILASASTRIRRLDGERFCKIRRLHDVGDFGSASDMLIVSIVARRGVLGQAPSVAGGILMVHSLWSGVEKPDAVSMEAITSEAQFEQVLAEADQANKAIVIDWMANWCRKCIYLKPKLEKLAAEYHPNIKFYYVDVNAVPQAIVKRAEVTKMPTIQLWKDGEKKGEVIGGHKAWLVLDEVREMLQGA